MIELFLCLLPMFLMVLFGFAVVYEPPRKSFGGGFHELG